MIGQICCYHSMVAVK